MPFYSLLPERYSCFLDLKPQGALNHHTYHKYVGSQLWRGGLPKSEACEALKKGCPGILKPEH